MSGRLLRLPLLALLIGIIAPLAAGAPPARGAEYVMETAARYVVEPDERRARVTVDVTFTNTTPDPQGRFSLFPAVELAIHDTATELAARDEEGELVTSAQVRDGVNVATIELREPLRYEESTSFSVSYTIPDGESPGLRIRPSIVVLPIWSFGTSGTVRVELPADYDVRADGDPLTAERDGELSVLLSGEIADPGAWLALVTADRVTGYESFRADVALESGTVALQVRAFADDMTWGEAARDLLVRALPLLEKTIDIGRSPSGPLVVIESVPVTERLEPPSGEAEIRVGFDEPPFTLLHQAAHLWIDEALLADRWSREGLASYAAGLVAAELEVPPPYDPVERREELAADAFPLAGWADEAHDGYGHPAAWAFFIELGAEIGHQAVTAALSRVADGRGAYDDEEAVPDATPAAAGARQLLDQLERTGGMDLAPRFVAHVFGPDGEAEVAERADARAAYDALVAAAGEWGPPDPVRAAMEEWRFADAQAEISAARAWIRERDALVADIDAAGLRVPTRLRDRYRQDGGGPEAQAELQAERGVVDAYRAGLAEASAERGLLARIGLVAGTSPDASLASANGLFGEGELRGASEAIEAARDRLAGAEVAGLLRTLAALVAVAAIIAVIALLLRRRRPVAGAP